MSWIDVRQRASFYRGSRARMIAHVTRREMYDFIWTEPLETVANQLGVSHWRLKDFCVQHRVPVLRESIDVLRPQERSCCLQMQTPHRR